MINYFKKEEEEFEDLNSQKENLWEEKGKRLLKIERSPRRSTRVESEEP